MTGQGLWGLYVRVQPPYARFTCRCGYDRSEQSSVDAVRLFVEQIGEAHRAVCRLGAYVGGAQPTR